MEIFLSGLSWSILCLLTVFILTRLFIWFMRSDIEDLQKLVVIYKQLRDDTDNLKASYEEKYRELGDIIAKYNNLIAEWDGLSSNIMPTEVKTEEDKNE